MKPLPTVAAALCVLAVTGCARMERAMTPAPTAAPAAPASGPVAVVPPMTTYGCDPMLAWRLGKSC